MRRLLHGLWVACRWARSGVLTLLVLYLVACVWNQAAAEIGVPSGIQRVVPYLVTFTAATSPQLTIGDGLTGTKQIKFDGSGTDQTLEYDSSIANVLVQDSAFGVRAVSNGVAALKLYKNDNTLVGSINVSNLGAYASVIRLTPLADTTPIAIYDGLEAQDTNALLGTTLKTCPTSGSTCVATSLIPAGCFLVGFDSRVTTAGNGTCASLSIGDGVTATLWSNATAVTVNTTTNNMNVAATNALGVTYPSAQSVTVTCNGGSFGSTAMIIRLTAHCLTTTAAAS